MTDQEKIKIFKFSLCNNNNGIVYNTDHMTWERATERNEWMKKFGSKNIQWLFDYEVDNLHVKLKMVPSPSDKIFEKNWT